MIKTVRLKIDVPPSREVSITLPDDVPVGTAEFLLTVLPLKSSVSRTLGDLAESEFFGMWRDLVE